MKLPTPTTATEIYLAAIHERQGEILTELRSQRPVDPSLLAKQIGEQIELREPKAAEGKAELKEPKRKAK